MSAPDDVLIDELAWTIHEAWCDTPSRCPWSDFKTESEEKHRDFYQVKAEGIFVQLEPVIGGSNVGHCVKVILEEMW